MGKRILIVEDEKIIAEDLKTTLLTFNYEILGIVSKGEEAVKKADTERPDLVLMDVMLAGEMTGLDAADIIYSQFDIPVIFLTAYASDEILAKATITSPFGYLIKPFEERELKVNVELAIYKHSLERNLRNSRNFLINLIDTVPNYISAKDSNLSYILVNKAFAELYNSSANDIIGKKDEDFLDSILHNKEQVKDFQDSDMKVLKTQEPLFILEKQIRFSGRNDKWLQITKVPMKSVENESIILTVAVDITKRKKFEIELERSNIQLQKLMEDTVNGLVSAMEKRDPYTAGHQRRVAFLADSIARELGYDENRIKGLRIASMVHDIGKINIPAEILSKPGKLNDLEMNLIKTHPEVGYDILSKINFPWQVADIVKQHHEKLDGSGYPNNLKAEEIIPEARILSVADVVEAIASHRPYRAALNVSFAIEHIKSNSNILYDSEVVEACISVLDNGFEYPKDENIFWQETLS
jgi:putative nucleotidyltransferase with HDIG domain/PAS domain S-box-containing protein